MSFIPEHVIAIPDEQTGAYGFLKQNLDVKNYMGSITTTFFPNQDEQYRPRSGPHHHRPHHRGHRHHRPHRHRHDQNWPQHKPLQNSPQQENPPQHGSYHQWPFYFESYNYGPHHHWPHHHGCGHHEQSYDFNTGESTNSYNEGETFDFSDVELEYNGNDFTEKISSSTSTANTTTSTTTASNTAKSYGIDIRSRD